MTLTDLAWSLLPFATGFAGYALARLQIAYGAGEEQPVVSRDFAAPGMRYEGIIEAEVVPDVSVRIRHAEGAAQ